jgi:hypothetical protein
MNSISIYLLLLGQLIRETNRKTTEDGSTDKNMIQELLNRIKDGTLWEHNAVMRAYGDALSQTLARVLSLEVRGAGHHL